MQIGKGSSSNDSAANLSKPAQPGVSLSRQIAKHVSSIVGLEEALTCENKILRRIWSAILIFAVCTTAYFVFSSTVEYYDNVSVTKVELKPEASYNYPPILVCPSSWLDADMALSLGLSTDAVKYSLGYFRRDNIENLANISEAKMEFLTFYNQSGFTCMEDYYKAISIDIKAAASRQAFGPSHSAYWCSACEDSVNQSLTRSYFDGKVCYLLNLKPETGSIRRPAMRRWQKIMFKIPDRTRGLLNQSAQWHIFATTRLNLALNYMTGSMLVLSPFTENTIRLNAQRVVTWSDEDSPCAYGMKDPEQYSSQTCFAKCLSDSTRPNDTCQLFYESITAAISSRVYFPSEYCNMYDLGPNVRYWDRRKYMDDHSDSIAESEAAGRCELECRVKCNRITHELTLRSQIAQEFLPGLAQTGVKNDKARNISSMEINIEHGALAQGGIITMTERNTYSFATLISNLGGALGLFVGGTMMTFVQIVLFAVKLVWERRMTVSEVK